MTGKIITVFGKTQKIMLDANVLLPSNTAQENTNSLLP